MPSLDLRENEELREAYIAKVKVYHPDSGYPTADADTFARVEEAYATIQERIKAKEAVTETGHLEFDIRHTAPQHRQYLDNEGIGYGTPSQRQKQYTQYRVHKAADNVREHRIQKLTSKFEDSLVVKDQKAMQKHKIRNVIERVVEDLILESMSKGEFHNLAGSGKPLEYTNRNPFVDTSTHNLNKILIDNGFAPEWIRLEKEIRENIHKARAHLALARHRLGPPPYSPKSASDMRFYMDQFTDTINDVNTKIHRYNLMVPILNKQMAEYNLQKEISKVTDNYRRYLPVSREYEGTVGPSVMEHNVVERIYWSDVWKNIKEMFS